MKARYALNSQSKSAMTKEIKRQIVEQEEKYIKGIDIMLLWTLHCEFGFGKQRLEKVYKSIIKEYKEMQKFFETDDTFPAEYKLKEIGIDIEKLRNEVK